MATIQYISANVYPNEDTDDLTISFYIWTQHLQSKKKRLLRHRDATVETYTGGKGGDKAASLTAHHWLCYRFKFRVWPMSSGVAKATLSLNVNFR